MTPKRVPIEDVVAAYKQTGSVWKAAKLLGLCGQSVWERLKTLDYPLSRPHWSKDELAELEALAQTCTIGEISRRLARPYAAVACKLSRLSIKVPRLRPVKVPRGAGYDKVSIGKHMKALEAYKGPITRYCRSQGLTIESMVQAIQLQDLAWWDRYTQTHAKIPVAQCVYCRREFYPTSAKQQNCSRYCQASSRVDKNYFGGNRRNTIGLAEKTCQLCERIVEKGLSSHHVFGKENDPDNEFLVALCSGCHHLVSTLGGRFFKATDEAWQNLINFVMLRRGNGRIRGVFTTVDIEEFTEDEWEEDE